MFPCADGMPTPPKRTYSLGDTPPSPTHQRHEPTYKASELDETTFNPKTVKRRLKKLKHRISATVPEFGAEEIGLLQSAVPQHVRKSVQRLNDELKRSINVWSLTSSR